jgi:hypothetical protein
METLHRAPRIGSPAKGLGLRRHLRASMSTRCNRERLSQRPSCDWGITSRIAMLGQRGQCRRFHQKRYSTSDAQAAGGIVRSSERIAGAPPLFSASVSGDRAQALGNLQPVKVGAPALLLLSLFNALRSAPSRWLTPPRAARPAASTQRRHAETRRSKAARSVGCMEAKEVRRRESAMEHIATADRLAKRRRRVGSCGSQSGCCGFWRV